MARWSHNFLAFCLAFGACSGNADETLNAQTVSGLLARQGDATPSYTNYQNLVIMPLAQTGDTQRLFVFHEDNREPSIFQLSRTDLPGIAPDTAAFRFSAKSNGRRVVAIYNDGSLTQAGYLQPTDKIPVSRPEIDANKIPDLAIALWLGQATPDTTEILSRIRLFEASYPEAIQSNPISLELEQFRTIKQSEPLLMTQPRIIQTEANYVIADWDLTQEQDAAFDAIILLANKDEKPLSFPITQTSRLRLHPLMSSGDYKPAKQSQITLNSVRLPPNSVALFVRPR